MIVSLLTQAANSYLIVSYDPSHSTRRELPQSLYIHGREFQVPSFIRDPSPETLMLACLTYALKTTVLYRSQPRDQYQYHFLISAVGLAISLAYVNIGTMRSWLPPFIIVAQVLSRFIHYLCPSLRSETIVEGERQEVQDHKSLCESS